jgi:large subunit ribosomal protein L5
MSIIKALEKKTFEALQGELGLKNVMSAPRLQKVVISVGTGRVTKDKNRMELIEDRLAQITGQKPTKRGAKKSVAAFKIRQGDIIGYQVTLRGQKMYDFLDRLINVALPRTRDFRGLSPQAIDEMGNFTIGVKEHTIFPETSDENLGDVFGLAITVVTSARDPQAAETFLRYLGFPLQKPE